MDSNEAEIKAREHIKQKHARIERIFFSNMYREGDVWVLKGQVEFKQALFFTTVKFCEVKVNTNTTGIVSYQEMFLRDPKEQQTVTT